MEQWIRLNGLEVPVSIGIHDFEKEGPQPYRIDIGLRVGPCYLVWTDSIRETVDYDNLRSGVLALVRSRHFNTQETVIQGAIEIAFRLDERVLEVDISVSKTTVYPDCESVGLRYRATKEQWLAAVSGRTFEQLQEIS